MVIIYHANNSLDAHMIRSLLEQHNIPAYVLGEHLQSGVGELPAGDLVKVAIDDKYEKKARNLIRDWENSEIIQEEAYDNPNLSGDGLNATA